MYTILLLNYSPFARPADVPKSKVIEWYSLFFHHVPRWSMNIRLAYLSVRIFRFRYTRTSTTMPYSSVFIFTNYDYVYLLFHFGEFPLSKVALTDFDIHCHHFSHERITICVSLLFSLSASQSNWYFTQNKQNIRQYIEHIHRRSNIKTAGRIIWAFEFFAFLLPWSWIRLTATALSPCLLLLLLLLLALLFSFTFFYLIAWLHSFTTHIDLTNNQEHIRYSKVRWAYPCGLCAWTVWYGERDRVHSLAQRHTHTHARTKSFR